MPLASGPMTTVSAMIPSTLTAAKPVISVRRSGQARSTMTTSSPSNAVSATGAMPRTVVGSKTIICPALAQRQLADRADGLQDSLHRWPEQVEQQVGEDAEGDRQRHQRRQRQNFDTCHVGQVRT